MTSSGLCIVAIVMLFVRDAENKLPTKPCRVSDPGFNGCVLKTAQTLLKTVNDGNPDLKLDGFDPFAVSDIASIDQPSLKFQFKNNLVYGSKNVKFVEFKLDPKAETMYIEYTSSGYMTSDYELDGRIFVFPVEGKGKSTTYLTDTINRFNVNYKTVKGKDGKDHWKTTNVKIDITPGKVTFDFTNLFNGNTELANLVQNFANTNWRDIFAELGGPIVKKLTDRVAKEMKRFLAAVPVEELITL